MTMHFYPYADDEAEVAECGALLGFGGDSTNNWGLVDCRRCLKRKAEIIAAHATQETAIVAQMGDMADYMRAQENSNE